MKRFLGILLSILMLASLCACQSNPAANNETTAPVTTPATEEVTEPLLESDVLEWVDFKDYSLQTDVPVKNVILMIGDGMGENIIKASEVVKGDKLVMQGIDDTVYAKTDSLSGLTDSAASATALSCGIKTENKYLGVNEDSEPVETMVEFAKAKGLKTGLVVTQIVPHATPAGMVCHFNSRSVYNTLFKQMLRANVDVLFGGGNQYYKGGVQTTAEEQGYQYISEGKDLSTLAKDKKSLGLFAYDSLDCTKTPSLTTMTEKALELLDNENGFFLMVEGSKIDSQEHNSNMEATLKEMQSFDKAVNSVLAWAEKNPGTLVIVTADHETGGVMLPKELTPENINNDCFTSNGEHTNANVLVMYAGAQSDKLFTEEVVENTEVSHAIRNQLNLTYGEKEVKLLNEKNR